MSDADETPVPNPGDEVEVEVPDEGAGSLDPAAGPLPVDGVVESLRQEWREGPDDDAPPESWLGLDDDELLHRIETEGPEANDELLMEIVESDRHFYIRQEAAKRVRDRAPLFDYEDDRHVGQILVRHLTRREDVTYLERLVARSTHVEVRAAAQVQLARLWGRVGGPTRESPGGRPALPPPEFREPSDAPGEAEARSKAAPSAGSGAAAEGDDDVDATLLGWALHFVIQEAWGYLGTTTTRGILRRTHAELLPANEGLEVFKVEDDAHVSVDLRRGPRVPRETVSAVARWLVAFLDAGSRSSDEVAAMDVRVVTRLMTDALEHVRFYEAVAGAWSSRR